MNKVLFVLGVLLLVLPFGLRAWDDKKQEDVVTTYQKNLDRLAHKELEAEMESARNYNRRMFETRKLSMEQYEKELDLLGNGMMGSLEIPQISLKLPIYHGTEEDILASGVGHMKESSLPVGGKNTHSILTGHRGLPTAQLFTRLDELEKGDLFSLKICGEMLHYKVCKIDVVKPEETENLQIQKGKDLVSLVTCTPYGINTHRLVVTGERIVTTKTIQNRMRPKFISIRDLCFLCIPILFIIMAILRKKRRKKKL